MLKERQGNERRIKRFKLDDKQVKEVLMVYIYIFILDIMQCTNEPTHDQVNS